MEQFPIGRVFSRRFSIIWTFFHSFLLKPEVCCLSSRAVLYFHPQAEPPPPSGLITAQRPQCWVRGEGLGKEVEELCVPPLWTVWGHCCLSVDPSPSQPVLPGAVTLAISVLLPASLSIGCKARKTDYRERREINNSWLSERCLFFKEQNLQYLRSG